MISDNKIGYRLAAVLLLISSLTVGVYASGTDKEQELKRIYKELIDDENRHDLVAVRKLVGIPPTLSSWQRRLWDGKAIGGSTT